MCFARDCRRCTARGPLAHADEMPPIDATGSFYLPPSSSRNQLVDTNADLVNQARAITLHEQRYSVFKNAHNITKTKVRGGVHGRDANVGKGVRDRDS